MSDEIEKAVASIKKRVRPRTKAIRMELKNKVRTSTEFFYPSFSDWERFIVGEVSDYASIQKLLRHGYR